MPQEYQMETRFSYAPAPAMGYVQIALDQLDSAYKFAAKYNLEKSGYLSRCIDMNDPFKELLANWGFIPTLSLQYYTEVIWRIPFYNWDTAYNKGNLVSWLYNAIMKSKGWTFADYAYRLISATDIGHSETVPGKVAYYASLSDWNRKTTDNKGRLTVSSFGKYMTRFFPMLAEKERAAIIEAFNEMVAAESAPLTFEWSTKADNFAKWCSEENFGETLNPYFHAPFKSLAASCMRYNESDWDTGIHPMRVYASGDFGIAVALKAGKVVARSIVPLNKGSDKDSKPFRLSHGPIYTASNAASDFLSAKLQELGAKWVDYDTAKKEWRGLRIAKIEVSQGILMPYVDLVPYGVDEGDFVRLSNNGEIDVQQTSGFCEDCGNYCNCENCGERVDLDDSYSSPNGWYNYCESCYHDRYATCEKTGEVCEVDSMVTVYRLRKSWGGRFMQDAMSVCQSWADDNAVMCEDDSEYWETGDCLEIQGIWYSPNFTEFFISAYNGEIYTNDEMVELPDDKLMTKDQAIDSGYTQDESGNWLTPETEQEEV